MGGEDFDCAVRLHGQGWTVPARLISKRFLVIKFGVKDKYKVMS